VLVCRPMPPTTMNCHSRLPGLCSREPVLPASQVFCPAVRLFFLVYSSTYQVSCCSSLATAPRHDLHLIFFGDGDVSFCQTPLILFGSFVTLTVAHRGPVCRLFSPFLMEVLRALARIEGSFPDRKPSAPPWTVCFFIWLRVFSFFRHPSPPSGCALFFYLSRVPASGAPSFCPGGSPEKSLSQGTEPFTSRPPTVFCYFDPLAIVRQTTRPAPGVRYPKNLGLPPLPSGAPWACRLCFSFLASMASDSGELFRGCATAVRPVSGQLVFSGRREISSDPSSLHLSSRPCGLDTDLSASPPRIHTLGASALALALVRCSCRSLDP